MHDIQYQEYIERSLDNKWPFFGCEKDIHLAVNSRRRFQEFMRKRSDRIQLFDKGFYQNNKCL